MQERDVLTLRVLTRIGDGSAFAQELHQVKTKTFILGSQPAYSRRGHEIEDLVSFSAVASCGKRDLFVTVAKSTNFEVDQWCAWRIDQTIRAVVRGLSFT